MYELFLMFYKIFHQNNNTLTWKAENTCRKILECQRLHMTITISKKKRKVGLQAKSAQIEGKKMAKNG